MGATVTLYMKPTCAYCLRAERLLRERGCTDLRRLRIDTEPELRAQMIERTGARTVPQIFIGGRYVGGCDELMALDAIDELAPLLRADASVTRADLPRAQPPDAKYCRPVPGK